MCGKPWESASRAYIVSQGTRDRFRILRSRFLPTRRFVRCTWARISNCRLWTLEETMLKPSLQLRIGQQLTMTPQLQQAIRLLQLPSLDLQAHVRETLETNVMLEAEDELASMRRRTGPRTRRIIPPAEEALRGARRRGARPRQREEPEVEIADEAWGEQTSGPSDSALAGRRRPQRGLQRPARPDAAGATDRAARARQAVGHRPGDSARDHRCDHRRRLSAR